jgi:hypothetical protein
MGLCFRRHDHEFMARALRLAEQGPLHHHPESPRRLRARPRRRRRRRRLARTRRRGACRDPRPERRRKPCPRRHRLRHPRTLQPPRPHAALRRGADRGRRGARGGGDARSEPAGGGAGAGAAARRRHRRRRRPAGAGGARAQHRLRLAHGARPPLGAPEAGRQPRRQDGPEQRQEPVDHRAGGAPRRPCLARPRLRHPHRRRHGARRRSAPDVRDVETSRQPLRVVVDSHLETPPTARILEGGNDAGGGGEGRCGEDRRPARRRRRGDRPAQPAGQGRPAAPAATLAGRGVNELHVEAGHKLNGSLMREGLVDELLLYFAPTLLGSGREMFPLPEI